MVSFNCNAWVGLHYTFTNAQAELQRDLKEQASTWLTVCKSHAVCILKTQPKSEPSVAFPAALEHIFVWL